MSEHSLYRRIIASEEGLWALPAQAVLRVAELLYAAGVALRNAGYNRRGPSTVLPIPVISVGNLTVGGTGKTPFVIELVRRLDRMGASPAVVSRGYGAVDGEPNDEERLIRRSCPGVVCVSAPDRSSAAEIAHTTYGADVIVLDDGFQHRRLGRTLDIVLVDATCPFGFSHLLPRGLLREPVASLGRADVVVLTRCDQVSRSALSQTEARLREVTGGLTLLKCAHRVSSIEHLDGTRLEDPIEAKRVVAFAGIAHPRAFVTTLRSLGAEIVGHRFWPDHHRYSRRDIRTLRQSTRFPRHELLVTTEKDAVKLAELDGLDPSGIAVIKVAIDFEGEGDTLLRAILEETLDGVRLDDPTLQAN